MYLTAMEIGTIVGSYQLLQRTGDTNWSEIFAARRVGTTDLFEAHVVRVSSERVRQSLVTTLDLERNAGVSHVAPAPLMLSYAGRIVLVAAHPPSEALRDLVDDGVRWPPLLALAMLGRISRAIDAAGRRPHGDLSTDNIFVRYDTKTCEVRMRGIALAVARARQRDPAGAVDFMAPERRADPGSAGVRADVYAMGIVLRELLTSSLEMVDEIVRRATANVASARYDDLAHLAYALEGHVASRDRRFDFDTEFANFVNSTLAARIEVRRKRDQRLIQASARLARQVSAPRYRPKPRPKPTAAPEPRPFVDPALALPVVDMNEALPTDDLLNETGPLPRVRPAAPLVGLLRLFFLGSLFVVAVAVAFLYVANEGLGPMRVAWLFVMNLLGAG